MPLLKKREDESHTKTSAALTDWHESLTTLLDALKANNEAWSSVFRSYETFSTATRRLYVDTDADALACVKALETRTATVNPGPSGEGAALFSVCKAKEDISHLLGRIERAKKLQDKRHDLWKKNPRLTKKKTLSEGDRATAADLDRLTYQLYADMEGIDQERLRVTDAAVLHTLRLQHYYYASHPARQALECCETARLAFRAIPREGTVSWVHRRPQDLLGGNADLQKAMSQSSPAIPDLNSPRASTASLNAPSQSCPALPTMSGTSSEVSSLSTSSTQNSPTSVPPLYPTATPSPKRPSAGPRVHHGTHGAMPQPQAVSPAPNGTRVSPPRAPRPTPPPPPLVYPPQSPLSQGSVPSPGHTPVSSVLTQEPAAPAPAPPQTMQSAAQHIAAPLIPQNPPSSGWVNGPSASPTQSAFSSQTASTSKVGTLDTSQQSSFQAWPEAAGKGQQGASAKADTSPLPEASAGLSLNPPQPVSPPSQQVSKGPTTNALGSGTPSAQAPVSALGMAQQSSPPQSLHGPVPAPNGTRPPGTPPGPSGGTGQQSNSPQGKHPPTGPPDGLGPPRSPSSPTGSMTQQSNSPQGMHPPMATPNRMQPPGGPGPTVSIQQQSSSPQGLHRPIPTPNKTGLPAAPGPTASMAQQSNLPQGVHRPMGHPHGTRPPEGPGPPASMAQQNNPPQGMYPPMSPSSGTGSPGGQGSPESMEKQSNPHQSMNRPTGPTNGTGAPGTSVPPPNMVRQSDQTQGTHRPAAPVHGLSQAGASPHTVASVGQPSHPPPNMYRPAAAPSGTLPPGTFPPNQQNPRPVGPSQNISPSSMGLETTVQAGVPRPNRPPTVAPPQNMAYPGNNTTIPPHANHQQAGNYGAPSTGMHTGANTQAHVQEVGTHSHVPTSTSPYNRPPPPAAPNNQAPPVQQHKPNVHGNRNSFYASLVHGVPPQQMHFAQNAGHQFANGQAQAPQPVQNTQAHMANGMNGPGQPAGVMSGPQIHLPFLQTAGVAAPQVNADRPQSTGYGYQGQTGNMPAPTGGGMLAYTAPPTHRYGNTNGYANVGGQYTVPVPQRAPQPAPQPVTQPAPQPGTQPVPQPVTQPAPQPVPQPMLQPASQSVPQSVPQSVLQPAMTAAMPMQYGNNGQQGHGSGVPGPPPQYTNGGHANTVVHAIQHGMTVGGGTGAPAYPMQQTQYQSGTAGSVVAPIPSLPPVNGLLPNQQQQQQQQPGYVDQVGTFLSKKKNRKLVENVGKAAWNVTSSMLGGAKGGSNSGPFSKTGLFPPSGGTKRPARQQIGGIDLEVEFSNENPDVRAIENGCVYDGGGGTEYTNGYNAGCYDANGQVGYVGGGECYDESVQVDDVGGEECEEAEWECDDSGGDFDFE